VLASLQVGAVSPPVKSESGYHLIKLLDQQVKDRPSFEDQKPELTRRLQRAAAEPELLKTVEKLRDLVFNSDGLQGPAEQLKLNVRESGWLDRHTADPLLGNAKVVGAAFSSEVLKGNNSDVLELAPDHYVVVRVKQHEAPTPRPLEDVKATIVASVKQERAVEEGKKLAQQFSEQLRKGEDLQKLAAAQGYAAQSVEKSTRSNGVVNPELLRAVFAMPRPAAQQVTLETVSTSNGDVVLVQLQAVEEGAADSLVPAQRNALAAQLRHSLGTLGLAAYMENIKLHGEIKRY
jgi:peptidyl-prolyl cis-trans isomerase D